MSGATTRRRWRPGAIALALSTLAVPTVAARRSEAHPLHTTLAELTVRGDQRAAEVVVRVFADDLQRGVGGRTAPDESAAAGYVGRHFAARDPRGRPIAWTSCGQRRTDDLVWICLRAPVTDAMAGTELRVDIGCAIYDDQVNVVRVVSPRGRRTLLFTCRERTQRLP